MSTSTGEAHDLGELAKLAGVTGRREGRSVVGEVGLRNDAVVTTHKFKLVFCLQGLVRVQVSLEFNVYKARCMIDKQTSTTIHLIRACLSSRREQAALGAADKVIDGHLLTGSQVIRLQHTFAITND